MKSLQDTERASSRKFTDKTYKISACTTGQTTPDLRNSPHPHSSPTYQKQRLWRTSTYTQLKQEKSSSPSILERKLSFPVLSNKKLSDDPTSTFSRTISPNSELTESMKILFEARESLYQLRQEARGSFMLTRKLMQKAQKSRKSSLATEELRNYWSFCNSEANDPIRELVENIEIIKNNILANEINYKKNELELKEKILSNDGEMKIEELQIEENSICRGCHEMCILA